MATRKWKQVGLIVLNLMWVAEYASAQTLERFTFAEPHLGTIAELTLYAPEETVANDAARAAFARMKELDLIFSDYKPESEAMRLCDSAGSGKPVKVSRELFDLLKQSVDVSEKTNGAFDVTVGPLVKLWRRARKEKVLPTAAEIAAAKELVGWKLVSLNEADQTVELKRTGMRLDFGGNAKGYIAQQASLRLKERGLKQTLVAIAGDIVAGDPPPASDGWKIGVAPLEATKKAPSRLLRLTNMAISTSGDAFQFVEIEGVRYSHIVDPQTGMGLTQRSSVTVVAPDGATADAWATAVCVIGTQPGLKLLDDQHLDALVIQATTDGVQVLPSSGFHRHEVK